MAASSRAMGTRARCLGWSFASRAPASSSRPSMTRYSSMGPRGLGRVRLRASIQARKASLGWWCTVWSCSRAQAPWLCWAGGRASNQAGSKGREQMRARGSRKARAVRWVARTFSWAVSQSSVRPSRKARRKAARSRPRVSSRTLPASYEHCPATERGLRTPLRWARRHTASRAASATDQKPRCSSWASPASRRRLSMGVMAAGSAIHGSAWGATRLRTSVWARWPRAEACPMAPMAIRSASGRDWSLSRSKSETQRTGI